jgi:hypothetical protein
VSKVFAGEEFSVLRRIFWNDYRSSLQDSLHSTQENPNNDIIFFERFLCSCDTFQFPNILFSYLTNIRSFLGIKCSRFKNAFFLKLVLGKVGKRKIQMKFIIFTKQIVQDRKTKSRQLESDKNTTKNTPIY